MEIVETPIFTKQVISLLNDDEYKMLQHYLICRPDAGVLITGSGGLRKLRWKLPGKGKRGGIRTIYYWDHKEHIYMLFCYSKNELENLSRAQLFKLKEYTKESFYG